MIILCLALLTSCNKVDFGKLETGKPYIGLYRGQDCVVVIDQAVGGNVRGRIYLDEGNLFASPVAFTSDLKKDGRGRLWINNEERNLKEIIVEKGSVEGEMDDTSFSLNVFQQPELHFKAQYMEPCHEVEMETNRIYAKDVEGLWSSYPDTDESFGTIYMNRAKRLTSPEKLNLDLDLYYPKELSEDERRPLLMLIHGGAFYNGDKQDLGFPEMGRYFAERGYVVASVNYRLGFKPLSADVDRAGYRALQDVHAAVCHLVDHADELGIDTTKIFAAGVSAGAVTALNLAFMRDENRPETTKNGGVAGFLSSFVPTVFHVINWGAGLLGIDWDLEGEGLCKDLDLDSDLGPINALSDSLSHPFHIKAVVNMWGAVQTPELLQNSRETDILSFHGDADRIVPYAYGYPFDHVLESSVENILDSLPDLVQPLAKMGRRWLANGKPFNEWAFNPMYGSSQIHDKALSLGMHSELHTVEGGPHSLHMDENRQLSVYFTDTIMPVMTRFLCEEMVGGKMVHLTQSGPWAEALDTDNVAELHWQVEGGVILSSQGDCKAKVLLFDDARRHIIMAGGKYKNGVEFRVMCPR